MSALLEQIREAFEWRPTRAADETWLPPGFEGTLRVIADFYRDRLDDPTLEAALWASALLLLALTEGSTCLALDDLVGASGFARVATRWRQDPGAWRTTLEGARLGDGGDDVQPLAYAHGRLYFDRYLRLEREIARALLAPLGPDALRRPSEWDDVCNQVFVGSDAAQRDFARDLFDHRVSVLLGGPGTGKTTTVARTLLALARVTGPPPSVAVVAPTGKAAQRLGDALASATFARESDRVGDVTPTVAPTTIHAFLGVTPITPRRRDSDPVPVDIVVCDETSMVDVTLLAELLRSLSENTRLVLVGDPNQLQSVDVGSALADLAAVDRRVLPGATLEIVHRGERGATSPVARDELLAFFEAIRDDRVDEAITLLTSGGRTLSLVEPSAAGALGSDGADALALVRSRAHALVDLAAPDASPAARSRELASVMVLAAQHRGDLSRSWWVEQVRRDLGWELLAYPHRAGMPVLVTASDPRSGVINGDTGLLVRVDDAGTLRFQPAVAEAGASRSADDARSLVPSVLQHWQPWWAMTIHKAQGSEFDAVIVSLTPGTRLISKQLFYTAVTRARERVIVVARIEDVRRALVSPARRSTGLTDVIAALRPGSGAAPTPR